MTPEQIIERLRVLFGIAPDDDTHDAELLALFDTALAAARTYTHRWLYPVARFQEIFQAIVSCDRCATHCAAVVSEVPVVEVEAAKRDGTDIDPLTIVILAAGAVYEKSGLLLFPIAPFSTLDLTYRAGFEELPADLAEALCQVAAAAGGASITAAGGTPSAAAVKKKTVFDVGTIEYETAQGSFFSGGIKVEPFAANAIVGPWATVLDSYVDRGKTLGGDDCVHQLTKLPDAAPLAAAAAPADPVPA